MYHNVYMFTKPHGFLLNCTTAEQATNSIIIMILNNYHRADAWYLSLNGSTTAQIVFCSSSDWDLRAIFDAL